MHYIGDAYEWNNNNGSGKSVNCSGNNCNNISGPITVCNSNTNDDKDAITSSGYENNGGAIDDDGIRHEGNNGRVKMNNVQ